MYDVQHGQPPRQKTNHSLVEIAEPSFLSLIDFIDTLFQCGFHAFQNITCDIAIWHIIDIVGWQKLAAFWREQNCHTIIRLSRIHYFSRQMRRFCA